MTYPTKKLGEVCDFKNGLWTGKKAPFVLTKVIRNTNFKNNDGTLNFNDVAEIEVEEKQLRDRLLGEGDLILERSGGGPTQPVGRVVYFDNEGEFSFSNFTSRIQVKNPKELDSKYLWRYLNLLYVSGVTEKMQKQTTGIRNLNFSEYKELKIPLPPMGEQRKIVAKLESVLGKIKDAKKLRAEAQTAAGSLLAAELHKIFEEGKKKGWEEKELDGLIETITPPVKIPKKDFGKDGRYPIIDQSLAEISGWTDDKNCLVDIKNPVVIFGDHTCSVKYSDRSFAQGADGIKILSTTANLLPRFLFILLKNQPLQTEGYRRHFSKLKKLKIPLPPLAEQKKIVARLDVLSEKITILRQAQGETSSAFTALEQSLLSRAFSGD